MRIGSTFLVLFLLLNTSVQAQNKRVFEGNIRFNFEVEGAGEELEQAKVFMPTGYIFNIKGESMRMSMLGGLAAAMGGDLIVNAKKKEQYMLMSATKTAMRIPMDEPETSGADQPGFTVTEGGDERVIQGYKCFHYVVVIPGRPESTIEMWLTEEIKLKMPRKNNSSLLMQAGKYGLNGFPLRMVVSQQGMLVRMEAVEIVKVDLPDSLFEIPKEYTVTDFNPDALDLSDDND